MQADVRLGQIRSGQMKKDPPRSESDPLKIHISEIITALHIRFDSFPNHLSGALRSLSVEGH